MSFGQVRSAHAPRCIVIAEPDGAGKTTFAREFIGYWNEDHESHKQ